MEMAHLLQTPGKKVLGKLKKRELAQRRLVRVATLRASISQLEVGV